MNAQELDHILKLCNYNPNLLSIEAASDEYGEIIKVILILPYTRITFTKEKHPELYKEVHRWVNKIIHIRGEEIHGVPS